MVSADSIKRKDKIVKKAKKISFKASEIEHTEELW
jgi:hypothetical protein